MSKFNPKIWAQFPALIQTSDVTLSKALNFPLLPEFLPSRRTVSFSFLLSALFGKYICGDSSCLLSLDFAASCFHGGLGITRAV